MEKLNSRFAVMMSDSTSLREHARGLSRGACPPITCTEPPRGSVEMRGGHAMEAAHPVFPTTFPNFDVLDGSEAGNDALACG